MKKKEESGVLYRKYRPQGWKDVVGQDHIVSVLENQIKLGNLAHAYLFSGSRGTGKTSVARIFAREVGTTPEDLYELDAASNRGIDDVREIREAVNTLPFVSKYKVYIFDEVHMLTRDAWNAFLKTLEEPPKHVIFILATTELEKVPETVISRCQTFVFRKPNQKILREFGEGVAKKEGVKLLPEAAELIALLGDGSFRDSHGILEKILSSTNEKEITREEVENVTGAPRAELVRNVLEAIVKNNLEKGLNAVALAREGNVDMKVFSKMILERMRFLFLLRLKAGLENHILAETSEDDFEFLKKLAGEANGSLTSETLVRFIEAFENSGRSTLPELSLELALTDSIKTV
ncbi:DNA polymerase III subunit gamma/tau [Candidatus Parcubacteria bacterium]|nr:DNA polymerase III subunit gamma/tau [Candidatus Parcubacteria bacterium]